MAQSTDVGDCLDENTVPDLLEGRLSPSARAGIEAHLDACPECRKLVAEAARMTGVRETEGLDQAGDLHSGELARGTNLGRYVVLDLVGSGAMGVVYSAYDPKLNRKVALKLVLPGASAQLRHRLLREAQTMARLEHPNVVTVYDAGTFGDRVFIAMAYVEGDTLADWCLAAPRSWREVLPMFLEAGRGLAAAHAAGIVHRDFKPQNVLVGPDGRVQVTDFGLARSVPAGAAEPDESMMAQGGLARTVERDPGSLPGTRTGVLLGTPAYMAPEQHQGQPADERSDQFAFCVALHEALYGKRPFSGKSWDDLRSAVIDGRLDDDANSARVPGWLRRIVVRGVHKDPAQRHPSMSSMLEALRRDPVRIWRRVLVAAVMVALAGVALVLGIREKGPAATVCTGAEHKLSGIWDDGQKGAIAAAFRATKTPYAEAAYQAVRRRLDTYASRWVSQHTEACLSTRIRQEHSESVLDLKIACLDRRLRALREAVRALGAADAKVVSRAVDVAGALPPIERCGDVAALRARVKPPVDPAAKRRVEELRNLLTRASFLLAAGKYREGLRIATSTEAAARRTTYRPLIAEAEMAVGRVQTRLGRLKKAERSLRKAYLDAQASRHDRLAADALVYLSYVVGYKQGRHARGQAWAEHARAAIDRLGRGRRLRADLLTGLGLIASTRGQFPEALALQRKALELHRRIYGPRHIRVAVALNNLAMPLSDLGLWDEALRVTQKSLQIRELELGQDHPRVADSLDNLGTTLINQYRTDQAIAALERALRIRTRNYGPDHSSHWAVLNSLGSAYSNQARYDRALWYLKRALRATRKAFGANHFRVAMPLHNLGELYRTQGKWSMALAKFRQAMALTRGKLGKEHPAVSVHLTSIGWVALGRGRLREAARWLGQSLRLASKGLGSKHPAVAMIENLLGTVRLRQGRFEEALGHVERAKSIWEKALPGGHPDLAEALTQIAEVHLIRRSPTTALPLLRRAYALQQKRRGDLPALAKTRFALARCLWTTGGDRRRARRLAREARDLFARIPFYARALASVRKWLARR